MLTPGVEPMLNRREFAMAGLGAAVGVACGTAAFGEQSTGQSHKAYFQLKQPLTVIAGDSLAIVLHFKSVYPKHVLGRFRLSVSDDPEVFDREEKCLAAMKNTDAWARLAAAYLIIHDQRAFDKLISAVPAVESSIAEFYLTMEDWDRAIAAYSKLIGDATTDASLLVKRGEAYFATKQFDLARADWRRAVELIPGLAQTQYDRLRQAERWSEAAEFALKLIEQNPEDTLVWLRIASVLALAEDPTVYSDFCGRMSQHFAESKTPETAERVVKASLLRADSIDLAKLPRDLLAKSLDDRTEAAGFGIRPIGSC